MGDGLVNAYHQHNLWLFNGYMAIEWLFMAIGGNLGTSKKVMTTMVCYCFAHIAMV